MHANHQAVRMEERQGQQQAIILGPAPRLGDGLYIGEQVALEEQRALRASGRAGGVAQDRWSVGLWHCEGRGNLRVAESRVSHSSNPMRSGVC